MRPIEKSKENGIICTVQLIKKGIHIHRIFNFVKKWDHEAVYAFMKTLGESTVLTIDKAPV